jgi:hypothetical protein
MLAWIGSIFTRSRSSVELNKNDIKKNDEDWMVVNTDLKSFSESEHNKTKASNNKTSLYTVNTLPGKKNKTATTMAAIGIGQKNSVTDNDLSLLKDKIGMAGINLTGFTNIPLNSKLKDSSNDNVDNILLAMKDKEQKMRKDKKLKNRNSKA